MEVYYLLQTNIHGILCFSLLIVARITFLRHHFRLLYFDNFAVQKQTLWFHSVKANLSNIKWKILYHRLYLDQRFFFLWHILTWIFFSCSTTTKDDIPKRKDVKILLICYPYVLINSKVTASTLYRHTDIHFESWVTANNLIRIALSLTKFLIIK